MLSSKRPCLAQAHSASKAAKPAINLLHSVNRGPCFAWVRRAACRQIGGTQANCPQPLHVCRVRGLGQEDSFSTHQTQQIALLAIVPVFLMTLKWAASTGPAALAIPAALLAVPIAGGGLRQLLAEGFSMAFSWGAWLQHHQKQSPTQSNRHMHTPHMQPTPAHHQHWTPGSPADKSEAQGAYSQWPRQPAQPIQTYTNDQPHMHQRIAAPVDRHQQMRSRPVPGHYQEANPRTAGPRTRAPDAPRRHTSPATGSGDDLDWPAEEEPVTAAQEASARAYAHAAWSQPDAFTQPEARHGSVSREEGQRQQRGRQGGTMSESRWLN